MSGRWKFYVFVCEDASGKAGSPHECDNAKEVLTLMENLGIVIVRESFGIDDPMGPRTAVVIEGIPIDVDALIAMESIDSIRARL